MNSNGTWSVQELRAELNRYERELQEAGTLTRSTINTYVQHPERFINWLDGRYRPVQSEPRSRPGMPNQGTSHDGTSMGPTRGTAATFTPAPPPPVNAVRPSTGSSRYDALRQYLEACLGPMVRLSFVEIERILGGPLPDSARHHRAWWANEQSGSHVHASSWMGAGRRTANVDLNAGMVDFVR